MEDDRSDTIRALHFTEEITAELHTLDTGWPLSNEEAAARARRIRPGWHWVRSAYLAGSRLILMLEPFAEPGTSISLPWRKEFDRWFKSEEGPEGQ